MNRQVHASHALLLALCVLGSCVVSQASIVGPYKVDDWTLHIWHLGEPAGSKTVADAAATAPLVLNVTGTPTLGSPSFAKFGTSILTGNNNYLSGGVVPLNRFTYSIEDEGGATATAEVLIEVVPK